LHNDKCQKRVADIIGFVTLSPIGTNFACFLLIENALAIKNKEGYNKANNRIKNTCCIYSW
jgi:hypothetical protein